MQKFLFAPWWNFYRLSFQDALIQGLCFWGFLIIILIIVSYYLYIKAYQKKGKQEVKVEQLNSNDTSIYQSHQNQESIIQNQLDDIQPQFESRDFWKMVGCDIAIVFSISAIIIFIVLVGYQSLQSIFQVFLIIVIMLGIFFPTLFFLYRINYFYIPYTITICPPDGFLYQQANRNIRKKYKKTKQKYQTCYTFIAWLVYLSIFFALTLSTKERCMIELPYYHKFDDQCSATFATLGQQDSILKQISSKSYNPNKQFSFDFPEDTDYIYQYFQESPQDDSNLTIANYFLPQNFTYANATVKQSYSTYHNYANIYDIENLKISVISNSKIFSSHQQQELIILVGNNIQDFGSTQCTKSIIKNGLTNHNCKKKEENSIPLQTYISVPGPLDTGSYWHYESANLQQIFSNSINLQDYNTLESSEKQKVKYNITNLLLIGQNVSISYIQMKWVRNDNISMELMLSKTTRHILISPIAVSKCDDNNDYQDPAHRQIIQKYLIYQKYLGVEIGLVIESSQTQPRYYHYEGILIAGGGQNDFQYDLGECKSDYKDYKNKNLQLEINHKKFYFEIQINDKDINVEFQNFTN